MSEAENLKARGPDGVIVNLRIEVSEHEPWRLSLTSPDGAIRQYQCSDLFESLLAMRRDLERAGFQLLCAGARPDVTTSGMSRSMGGGRKAYVVHMGSPASRSEMVDIFDYAEPELVGTVQQQQEYLDQWINSLRRRQ
jgi:hypothetical protein